MCCCDRKKRDACLSEASCASLPIATTQHQEPRRGDALRSPFFAYFLWRDKESERLPGRPRQRTPVRRKQTTRTHKRQSPGYEPGLYQQQSVPRRNDPGTINNYITQAATASDLAGATTASSSAKELRIR